MDKDDLLRHLVKLAEDCAARLARIESVLKLQLRVDETLETDLMALRATDQALVTEIHRNTDIAKAAGLALTTLAGNVADLTTKLAAAIADSPAADDPEVQAALAELKANNDLQQAATPAVAAAIANTDPSAPVPTVDTSAPTQQPIG